MIAFWGLVSIVLAPLVPALAVHVTRDLGRDETILGLLLTAYGVGTVSGSLLMSRVARGSVAPRLFGGVATIGLALLTLALADAVPVLLALAVTAGAARSAVLVTYLTVRTIQSPDELLGRIGATARTVSLGLQPLGFLLGGALIDLTSGSTTIVVLGIALLVLTALFLPVRAIRVATLQAPRAV